MRKGAAETVFGVWACKDKNCSRFYVIARTRGAFFINMKKQYIISTAAVIAVAVLGAVRRHDLESGDLDTELNSL